MSTCQNNPVELMLATTDINLYDSGWKWSDDLYWSVDCLPSRQTTVSDIVVPDIKESNYVKVSTTPVDWDFCKSENCTPTSQSLQIVLTFDPSSKDPMDYLQYVINVNLDVTHSPSHTIKDSAGQEFAIDIVEVSKLAKQPYVEVWIASGTPMGESDGLSGDGYEMSTKDNTTLWILIGLFTLFLIVVFVVFIIKYYYKPKVSNPIMDLF